MTDRFLIELRPVAAGQVPKDADLKYENLVQGLKHVPIKVSFVDVQSVYGPFHLTYMCRSGHPKHLRKERISWPHYLNRLRMRMAIV